MTKREWFDTEKGKSIGTFRDEFAQTSDGKNLVCPRCGKNVTYCELGTGDNEFGRQVFIWWYECDHCGIATEEKGL